MEGSRFRARRSIDIRPGSGDNFVNVKSRGKIPVAILSTADFDAAARIAIGSLTFGRDGHEPSLSHCGGPEDVDGDGLADIVCHFDAQTAAFQPGDIEGILSGETHDGLHSRKGRGSRQLTPAVPAMSSSSSWTG